MRTRSMREPRTTRAFTTSPSLKQSAILTLSRSVNLYSSVHILAPAGGSRAGALARWLCVLSLATIP